MTDPSLDPILAYLREHSGRYSDSALRDQLVQTGYDPALVDRAIAVYRHENPPTVSARVWPRALQVLAVNVVLVGLGFAGLTAGTESLAILVVLTIGGELVGGIVLAIRPRSRVWGRALLFGFLLTIALALLLAGACILIASQIRLH